MWLKVGHPFFFELRYKIAPLSYSAGLLTLKLLERKSFIPITMSCSHEGYFKVSHSGCYLPITALARELIA